MLGASKAFVVVLNLDIGRRRMKKKATKDTKLILRSRPLGRECPVLKEVREWVKSKRIKGIKEF